MYSLPTCNQIGDVMAIPFGAEVKLYWSLQGQLAINVIGAGIRTAPTFDQALADQIGAAVKSAFTANLALHFATTSQLVRVGVRDLRTDSAIEYRDSGAAVAGTAVGDAMPASVAMVITSRTAGAGKSFRGRTYLSGWSEAANQASGTALPAASTAAVAFINAVGQAIFTPGMNLAVLTRPQEDTVITRTVNHRDGTTEVTILSHQTQKDGAKHDVLFVEARNAAWESQRRRVNGRGALPTSLDSIARAELPTA